MPIWFRRRVKFLFWCPNYIIYQEFWASPLKGASFVDKTIKVLNKFCKTGHNTKPKSLVSVFVS